MFVTEIDREDKMNARDIIDKLKLVPHDREGGYFVETARSPVEIAPDKRGNRSLYTAIYYMLTTGEPTAAHRLKSDEMWFFHAGDPIELSLIIGDGVCETVVLGRDMRFQAFIPALAVQSARKLEGAHGFALVSTVVVPGFEYCDFETVDANV
jgi:uncharacterized protein